VNFRLNTVRNIATMNPKSSPKIKKGEKRLTRLQVMLSAGELTALDNFRFEKRMPSRASAIREILRRGLDADGFNVANAGTPSKAFGVIKGDGRS